MSSHASSYGVGQDVNTTRTEPGRSGAVIRSYISWDSTSSWAYAAVTSGWPRVGVST